MKHSIVDADMLATMLRNGYQELLSQKEAINNLNVFPVPDGDTGLNMSRTMQGGIESLESGISAGMLFKRFSKGALMSARGNSGVILSQFLRGLAKDTDLLDAITVYDFITAIENGRDQAYSTVVNPVEGTMLTLMTDATKILRARESEIYDFEDLFLVVLPELEASLQRTPSLLPVLAEAGVVDSGAAGLLAIFRGMAKAINGEILDEIASIEEANKTASIGLLDEDSSVEFGYCTEFIVQLFNKKIDVASFDIDAFIEELKKLGDSIVALQDENLVKVHIHTKEPEKALAFAHNYGEFLTLKIENMTLQHNEVIAHQAEEEKIEHQKYAVITTSSGKGITEYFKGLGTDVIIDGGQTNNPSAEDFINAFKKVDADHIVVLPNNSNIILTAKQAASMYDHPDIRVIPTKSLAEGFSSLSLMDKFLPDIDSFVEGMTYALANVTTGLVSTATRDAEMDGVSVKQGEYIGIIDKTIKCSGTDKLAIARDLVLGYEDIDDKDVLTVFYGSDVTEDEVFKLQEELSDAKPMLEIGFIPGGQDVYSFIMAIE